MCEAPAAHRSHASAGHERPWLDRLGIGVSMACAVHCIAAGLLAAAPAFAASAAPHLGERLEWLEGALLWVALGVGTLALLPAAREHRSPWPISLFVAGIAVLGLARVVPYGHLVAEHLGVGHEVGTVVGISLIATAHALNLRAHARLGSHTHGAPTHGAPAPSNR